MVVKCSSALLIINLKQDSLLQITLSFKHTSRINQHYKCILESTCLFIYTLCKFTKLSRLLIILCGKLITLIILVVLWQIWFNVFTLKVNIFIYRRFKSYFIAAK